MKRLIIILFVLLSMSWFTFALVDHLYVQVRPDTPVINEAVDLIIKAVDANWDVVKDYTTEAIYVKVDWGTQDDYKFENEFITMADTDQWEKEIHKDLTFIKKWTYTLSFADVIDSQITWEVVVNVIWEWDKPTSWLISIETPVKGSVELSSSVNIVAKSNIPTQEYVVYVDDEKKTWNMTDENWDINASVDWLKPWNHVLSISIIDIEWKVTAESEKIDFSIEWSDEKLFKTIEFIPSNTASRWDSVKVVVTTADTVWSAELDIKWMSKYPMDGKWDGKFETNVLTDIVGQFSVNLSLIVEGVSNDFENVGTLIVTEENAIKTVRYVRQETNQIDLDWDYIWQIKKFRVDFWTWKDQLNSEIVVTENKAILKDVNEVDTYYVQIFPLDDNEAVSGKESDIVVIEPSVKWSAIPVCKVQGILIWTQRENDKYYLTWQPVEWASKYIVYKSETETKLIKDMQKVWETQETRFEYPFDNKAMEDVYNYYGVEAVCEAGNVQVDNIKKVKVWPWDTMLFIMLLSMFVFFGYKLYWYSK